MTSDIQIETRRSNRPADRRGARRRQTPHTNLSRRSRECRGFNTFKLPDMKKLLPLIALITLATACHLPANDICPLVDQKRVNPGMILSTLRSCNRLLFHSLVLQPVVLPIFSPPPIVTTASLWREAFDMFFFFFKKIA